MEFSDSIMTYGSDTVHGKLRYVYVCVRACMCVCVRACVCVSLTVHLSSPASYFTCVGFKL